jgi:heme-degrading monooxygenase HmoA
MFTHLAECEPVAGKREEVSKIMRGEMLATLQRQPGFVDLIALRDSGEQENLVYLTFWETREEAEHFERSQYDRIVNRIGSLLNSRPATKTFQVDDSTVHRIAASRAA